MQRFAFENEKIQSLLLEMGQQRTTRSLFKLITNQIFEFDKVALVRIWLVQNGDICPSCRLAKECLDPKHCLHLVASTGASSVNQGQDWSRIDGAHRRFPIGARKIGHIAATGKPVVVASIEKDSKWIGHPQWAKRESIKGFAGHPMWFNGENLGVLGVFTKTPIEQPVLDILTLITNHAAAALANARAFETIEKLTKQLKAENTYLKEELSETRGATGFIGKSLALKRILDQIDLVAATGANVLILGESGTGKELVAREIHHRSCRSDRPLIKINCASVPRELFASEFFGHAKGAFTGALSNREGKFGASHQGSLFLDEVGEIPLELQAQLLRVLQEGEYERIGEEKVRTVDTRIIAATNRDLKNEVTQGNFREDLYFRLNVFPILVPPLRERKEDIQPLAEFFLRSCLQKMNRPLVQFTRQQMAQLQTYHWPGNVRELQNVVERFAITTGSSSAQMEILNSLSADPGQRDCPDSVEQFHSVRTEDEMIQLQVQNIKNALELCQGKIYGHDGAAALLGLRPTTLATRIKKLKISRH